MPFNKIILSGGLPDGEVWSTGVAFSNETGTAAYNDFNDLQTWADQLKTSLQAGGTGANLLSLLSSGGTITLVTVQTLDNSGVLLLAAESIVTGVVGSDSPRLPHQAAVVMSMRTGRPGRSYRGRNYWPGIGAVLQATTLKIGSPSPDLIADDWAALLQLMVLDQPIADTLHPFVWSATLGHGTRVNSILVGNVVDTQRRRRNQVPELYASQDYPPSP